MKAFELDPANYLTAPGLACDAALKWTNIKLELFYEGQEDMHLFFERMKKEGLAIAVKRLVRTEKYERKNEIIDSSSLKESVKNWILYLDANNLYRWAISQYLPTGSFNS